MNKILKTLRFSIQKLEKGLLEELYIILVLFKHTCFFNISMTILKALKSAPTEAAETSTQKLEGVKIRKQSVSLVDLLTLLTQPKFFEPTVIRAFFENLLEMNRINMSLSLIFVSKELVGVLYLASFNKKFVHIQMKIQ